jgi:hypothetical protein
MFGRIATRSTQAFTRRSTITIPKRRMGGGGSAEPHIPEGYNTIGKWLSVTAFFWIFYRAKENKGQLFGLYAPWLDEHHHPHHHHGT